MGAMRALWSDAPASFAGRHVGFDRVHLAPQPNRPIPIVLGGNSEPVVDRAARIADGWFPFTISPEEFATSADKLRAIAAEHGRDPAAIRLSVWPGSYDWARQDDAAFVRQYVDAGATRVIVHAAVSSPAELPQFTDQLTRYQEEVIARL
jgi:alkanesulfonate monooxygenase SsuD/methylene tetrahydromethanopterin reductase-like flavin-dependent oxidoreductase (luciferase family)